MQLKRILARDTRTATDKAIALYGDDVLIISNHMVNGQTELVVLDGGEPDSSRLIRLFLKCFHLAGFR